MKDFDDAGGIPALIKELGEDYIHLDLPMVSGRSWREITDMAVNTGPRVIHPLNQPFVP